MPRVFFVLAIRNLLKRKMFSCINIFGLALGVAACLVILNYVDYESRYDSYHKHASQLYRVDRTVYQNDVLKFTTLTSTYGLGPSMLAEVPEVKRYIRTHPLHGGSVVLTYQPATGDPVSFHETNLQMVDSTFLDAFTYNATAGDLTSALDNPNSIVVTKALAEKYFGPGEDAIGKVLTISGGRCDGDYQVSAVIDNVPRNSHLTFDVLVPLHNVLKTNGQYSAGSEWGWNNFVTYVELYPEAHVDAVTQKLPALADKYINKRFEEDHVKIVIGLQPIRDIHLHPGVKGEPNPTTGFTTLYFFIVIAVFILTIAWINYVNLSTAQAMERAHEVGIKKAIGALRSELIRQFMLESVVVNFLGIVLAMVLALALLPVLNQITGKDLSFNFADPRLSLILVTLFVVGSVISGLYPAFVLSSFKITAMLKAKSERDGFGLRKTLVVFQFASSLVLIAGTFGVYRQIMFMRTQHKGLTVDQMLIVQGPTVVQGAHANDRLVMLKNDIRRIPGVINVTTSAAIPGGGYNWGATLLRAGDQRSDSKGGSVVWVDPDFVDTYNMTLVAGRNFNPNIRSDMESVLINEAAVTALGLGSPEQALRERILLETDTVAIVGVLKNYNWSSLKTDYGPFVFKADTVSRSAFSIHLDGNNMQEAIQQIGARFREVFPGNPYDYYFLDDFFNRQYQDDQQFGKIFGLFAGLAIAISCLGLWGLASFTTAQKRKEISIRKVLGASTENIMSLLSWQFMRLVMVAGVIGLPLAWYGLYVWLGSFAFRIGLQWDLFVVPFAMLCGMALLTVSFQIFRGANTNPATILRSE
ncbi:ABC transporter permease [Chryseolinea lacunae]|uniref:ABC transporter permease n=1 Tax=Chryseolinea lacunae TaxID=2801331 RepID=A0ABS1KME6_9BACT|nr:ABC transporter permease [Chryseolinea lacunae]MBL0740509.1 ABC transporter permease [Chryseolinea lacunae]